MSHVQFVDIKVVGNGSVDYGLSKSDDDDVVVVKRTATNVRSIGVEVDTRTRLVSFYINGRLAEANIPYDETDDVCVFNRPVVGTVVHTVVVRDDVFDGSDVDLFKCLRRAVPGYYDVMEFRPLLNNHIEKLYLNGLNWIARPTEPRCNRYPPTAVAALLECRSLSALTDVATKYNLSCPTERECIIYNILFHETRLIDREMKATSERVGEIVLGTE